MSEVLDRDVESCSSSETVENPEKDELVEPEAKRRKMSKIEKKPLDKLEHRLGGILCCAVCIDLPKAAVYQCSNGHLMCAGCFTHVLADARLRDETATCPNCRVEISKDSASRNLAVENAISELPSECQYCSKEFARNSLDYHQDTLCEERFSQILVGNHCSRDISLGGLLRRAAMHCVMFVSMMRKPKIMNYVFGSNVHRIRTMGCKYKCIGCPWFGPQHEVTAHEECCAHPKRSGAEVMATLQTSDRARLQDKQLYDTLLELLSYEKIAFNDLQFKPYRTEEYVNKLFYETSRFTAFNNQWVVKAHINNSQRDPTQSSERDITYQLILKSKTTSSLSLHYVIMRGPFGDMRTTPRVYHFEFNERESESTSAALPLPDTNECNRLLANKAINFRLIMFLSSK